MNRKIKTYKSKVRISKALIEDNGEGFIDEYMEKKRRWAERQTTDKGYRMTTRVRIKDVTNAFFDILESGEKMYLMTVRAFYVGKKKAKEESYV